jgi:hypothetical protein
VRKLASGEVDMNHGEHAVQELVDEARAMLITPGQKQAFAKDIAALKAVAAALSSSRYKDLKASIGKL